VRALIAEDDRVTALMLARTLERWGFEVSVAPDGNEAWRILEGDPKIAMALFDWMMPGIDGPELCRRVRRDESRAHTHVILITSRDSRADLVAGLDAGADDYLIKPFDPEELRARVHVAQRVLKLHEKLTERVVELQEALARVKTLQGLLPICCYCKSVRTDQNYWQQVEQYIGQRSEVQFSHGICPQCYEKAIAELESHPEASGR
jgi:sigma-B regulation protein RsbU (phosphoserine phosphatase)